MTFMFAIQTQKQQECLSALCCAIFKVEEVIVVNAQIYYSLYQGGGWGSEFSQNMLKSHFSFLMGREGYVLGCIFEHFSPYPHPPGQEVRGQGGEYGFSSSGEGLGMKGVDGVGYVFRFIIFVGQGVSTYTLTCITDQISRTLLKQSLD